MAVNLLVIFALFQLVSSEVLEEIFENASNCEYHCDGFYTTVANQCGSCCKRGCRLFTMIDLAKEGQNLNTTLESCLAACKEAYNNASQIDSCYNGCKGQVTVSQQKHEQLQQQQQTLHLLTPLLYIREAYNTLANHVHRLITTSWTLYVQQDTGQVVVVKSQPQVIAENIEPEALNEQQQQNNVGISPSERSYPSTWEGERPPDWMDCISHQSGLPRWLLVVVLFGLVVALVWLCCATTVTAPHQHVAPHKVPVTRDLDYLLVCEPMDKIKIQPVEEQALPLPVKTPLPL